MTLFFKISGVLIPGPSPKACVVDDEVVLEWYDLRTELDNNNMIKADSFVGMCRRKTGFPGVSIEFFQQ
jgi:hypothetical protein